MIPLESSKKHFRCHEQNKETILIQSEYVFSPLFPQEAPFLFLVQMVSAGKRLLHSVPFKCYLTVESCAKVASFPQGTKPWNCMTLSRVICEVYLWTWLNFELSGIHGCLLNLHTSKAEEQRTCTALGLNLISLLKG